jgi:hypothetical protein
MLKFLLRLWASKKNFSQIHADQADSADLNHQKTWLLARFFCFWLFAFSWWLMLWMLDLPALPLRQAGAGCIGYCEL